MTRDRKSAIRLFDLLQIEEPAGFFEPANPEGVRCEKSPLSESGLAQGGLRNILGKKIFSRAYFPDIQGITGKI